jgi:hypothetical protein
MVDIQDVDLAALVVDAIANSVLSASCPPESCERGL